MAVRLVRLSAQERAILRRGIECFKKTIMNDIRAMTGREGCAWKSMMVMSGKERRMPCAAAAASCASITESKPFISCAATYARACSE